MGSATLTGTPTVADAIEHALQWLDKQGCAANGPERRGVQRSRYRVMARITYHPPGAEAAQHFEVATRNLSRTGMSFLHRTLIYPRQTVEVQLPLPDHSIRLIRARVVRVRSSGQGQYEIGVEFTDLQVAVA